MRASTGGHNSPLRVLIADKCAHFRETVRRVLSQQPEALVVGEAETLLDAARQATARDPDIVLLDIELVMNEDPARLRRLAEAFPYLQVVVMLNEDSADYRAAVGERWGYSCIVKEQAEEDLASIVGATSGHVVR